MPTAPAADVAFSSRAAAVEGVVAVPAHAIAAAGLPASSAPRALATAVGGGGRRRGGTSEGVADDAGGRAAHAGHQRLALPAAMVLVVAVVRVSVGIELAEVAWDGMVFHERSEGSRDVCGHTAVPASFQIRVWCGKANVVTVCRGHSRVPENQENNWHLMSILWAGDKAIPIGYKRQVQ